MKTRLTYKYLINLSLRYLSLLILGLIVAYSMFFYKLLLPLTIYPTKAFLSLSYETYIAGSRILVDSLAIDLIPACIAVSAYLLLLILNLTTPMPTRKRFYSILTSLTLLLLVNIIRIYTLSIMLINGSGAFDIVHKTTWYLLSIIMVVGIWFLTVYLFKIKDIPMVTDLKCLIEHSEEKIK